MHLLDKQAREQELINRQKVIDWILPHIREVTPSRIEISIIRRPDSVYLIVFWRLSSLGSHREIVETFYSLKLLCLKSLAYNISSLFLINDKKEIVSVDPDGRSVTLLIWDEREDK